MAWAHGHVADGSAGASEGNGSTLFGFYASFGKTLGTLPPDQRAAGKQKSWGILVDFNAHVFGGTYNRYTLVAGPRFTVPGQRDRKGVLSTYTLIGGLKTSAAGTSETDLAVGVGAQWDYFTSREMEKKRWGLRLQFDVIHPVGSEAKTHYRASLGVVKRWNPEH
jgi:hypothetical protein